MAAFTGLSRIGQIAVRVRDIERAVRFYRDVLGLPFVFQYPQMAFFDAGGTWLYLTTANEPEHDHPASILYFDVADIEAAYGALKARGAEMLSEPHPIHRAEGKELWLAGFRDGEGNTFELRSWKTAS